MLQGDNRSVTWVLHGSVRGCVDVFVVPVSSQVFVNSGMIKRQLDKTVSLAL